MIPAIPEQAPFPDAPTCCTDVFTWLEGLLAWIWTGTEDSPGIAECVGEDTSECGAMVRYVSWGPPIIRPWAARNLLAVYLANPAVAIHPPAGRAANSNAIGLTWQQDVNIGIELWEGCYPIPPDDGNGPSYLRWHEANRHAYAHGMRLYQRLLEGVPSHILGSCQSQSLGGLTMLDAGEPGLSVGWRASLRVTW